MENIIKPSEMAGCSSIKCSRKLMSERIMHKHQLPDEVGEAWKNLARQLNFKEAFIDTTKNDKGDTKECCIAVIVAWINQEGKDATVERLADALTRIGLKKVAEILQGLLLSEENDEPGTNGSKQMENRMNEIEKNCDQLKRESRELHGLIQELRKELSRLKQDCQDTSQKDFVENFDNSPREVDLEDTRNNLAANRADTEAEIDAAKVKHLNGLLCSKVTSVLEKPETRDKLNVLTRLSESLQELYNSVLSIAADTCKCTNEEVKGEFYDFAYHGLRAEHNDLVHRVEDLAAALEKMNDEEKEEFGKLQELQTNRQRKVDSVENLCKGHFPRNLRRQCGDSGTKPKQAMPTEQNTSPVTETMRGDKKFGTCFTNVKESVKKILSGRKGNEENSCRLTSYSAINPMDS